MFGVPYEMSVIDMRNVQTLNNDIEGNKENIMQILGWCLILFLCGFGSPSPSLDTLLSPVAPGMHRERSIKVQLFVAPGKRLCVDGCVYVAIMSIFC